MHMAPEMSRKLRQTYSATTILQYLDNFFNNIGVEIHKRIKEYKGEHSITSTSLPRDQTPSCFIFFFFFISALAAKTSTMQDYMER